MKKLIGLGLLLGALWVTPAAADQSPGKPIDPLLGCDSFAGRCDVSFDAQGHISASFYSFLQGQLTVTAASVTAASNAAWVDTLGHAVDVHSYTLQVSDFYDGSGFAAFHNGAVGICRLGVTGDGSACAGATGDDKSDVALFNYNYTENALHIDFLSAGAAAFNFATDFNVLGSNAPGGALYYAASSENGEDVFYHITSNNVTGGVPEPSTWAMMLVGFGGLGALLRRRGFAVAVTA